jgi:hypothetical protein
MSKIIVELVFEYDENEDIQHWDIETDHTKVDGLNTAIDVARAEVESYPNRCEFTYKAYYEDSPDTAISG